MPGKTKGTHLKKNECRDANGNKTEQTFATPSENNAIAYAFKAETNPKDPLLVCQIEEGRLDDQQLLIPGYDYNQYLKTVKLQGTVLELPIESFKPVSAATGEYSSSNDIELNKCQINTVKLTEALDNNFQLAFINREKAVEFFKFLDEIIAKKPLEEHGIIKLTPTDIANAKKTKILEFKNKETVLEDLAKHKR